MAEARVTQTRTDDVLLVAVTGYIGESADIFNLQLEGVSKLVMDLGGINYINSVGVKNWIVWSKKIPAGLSLELVNCPALIINQINLVAGFLKSGGTVETLFAPYLCETCNHEDTILLSRGLDYEYASQSSGSRYSPAAASCPKCSQPMVFDGIESKFFHFLKTLREPKSLGGS